MNEFIHDKLKNISYIYTGTYIYIYIYITAYIYIYIYFFFFFFSESCIERWSKAKGGNNKCPQCNAPARKIDIRNINTKAIKAINTTERDRALADLEKEKEA